MHKDSEYVKVFNKSKVYVEHGDFDKLIKKYEKLIEYK